MKTPGIAVEIFWVYPEATVEKLFNLLEALDGAFGGVSMHQLVGEHPMGIARLNGRPITEVGIGVELHKLYVIEFEKRYGQRCVVEPVGNAN